MSWEKGEGDMASEKLLQALPPESERMDAGPEKTTNRGECEVSRSNAMAGSLD